MSPPEQIYDFIIIMRAAVREPLPGGLYVQIGSFNNLNAITVSRLREDGRSRVQAGRTGAGGEEGLVSFGPEQPTNKTECGLSDG